MSARRLFEKMSYTQKKLVLVMLLYKMPLLCGYSLMVKLQPSKLITRVRFPLPAPFFLIIHLHHISLIMKARFGSQMLLCTFCLAFAGMFPGVAQGAADLASRPNTPVNQSDKPTKAESALIQKMTAIVQAGQKAGALNVSAVAAVFAEAAKMKVTDTVMAQLVAIPVAAFPANAPQVAAAAVKSYGAGVTTEQVRNIVKSAVAAHPHPYASVAPIAAEVTKVLGDSPVAAEMKGIAVEIAGMTPDNPLEPVTIQEDGLTKESGDDEAGGALVLPGGTPIGGTPTSPEPVSNPSGN